MSEIKIGEDAKPTGTHKMTLEMIIYDNGFQQVKMEGSNNVNFLLMARETITNAISKQLMFGFNMDSQNKRK